MPTPRLALALLVALLLPSCVQWRMGERIRESCAVHVGVDVYNPAVRYYKPGHEFGADYVLAPEITYKAPPPIVGFLSSWEYAKQVQPTGKLVLAETAIYQESEPRQTRLAERLPKGLRAVPARVSPEPSRVLMAPLDTGDIDSPLARPASTGARMVAAPFDYVIDPALSAVSTVVVAVPVACVAVVIAPLTLIWPELLP